MFLKKMQKWQERTNEKQFLNTAYGSVKRKSQTTGEVFKTPELIQTDVFTRFQVAMANRYRIMQHCQLQRRTANSFICGKQDGREHKRRRVHYPPL